MKMKGRETGENKNVYCKLSQKKGGKENERKRGEKCSYSIMHFALLTRCTISSQH